MCLSACLGIYFSVLSIFKFFSLDVDVDVNVGMIDACMYICMVKQTGTHLCMYEERVPFLTFLCAQVGELEKKHLKHFSSKEHFTTYYDCNGYEVLYHSGPNEEKCRLI